jgi:hypothetical protein
MDMGANAYIPANRVDLKESADPSRGDGTNALMRLKVDFKQQRDTELFFWLDAVAPSDRPEMLRYRLREVLQASSTSVIEPTTNVSLVPRRSSLAETPAPGILSTATPVAARVTASAVAPTESSLDMTQLDGVDMSVLM